jgi:holo-[acyl-carrier protein] synthase
MILGMGSDMVDIRRMEKTVARFGERFLARTFSDEEIRKAKRREGAGIKAYAGTLAKRFAAKEACSKALGTGFNQGVFMRDIYVVNEPSGKPVLRLRNGALKALHKLHPAAHIDLTLTDEYPYAQAWVIITAPA